MAHSWEITFDLAPEPQADVLRCRLESPMFGQTDTTHLALATFADRTWQSPRIIPFSQRLHHPAEKAFQYGQSIFEAMQAYKNGASIHIFRLSDHARRFRQSAFIMGFPEMPEDLFAELTTALVWAERIWLPPGEGASLYIRAFMFATEPSVRCGPSSSFDFCILVSPSVPFFDKAELQVYVSSTIKRAWPGGTGRAKFAGNYGGALRTSRAQAERECDQTLFLDKDGVIEELDVTNFFTVMADGRVRTPLLHETVLDGITRRSVLSLAKAEGIAVEEVDYKFEQLHSDAKAGKVKEAFCTGTAAGLVAISSFDSEDSRFGKFVLGDGTIGPVTAKLRSKLLAVRSGAEEDANGWLYHVSPVRSDRQSEPV